MCVCVCALMDVTFMASSLNQLFVCWDCYLVANAASTEHFQLNPEKNQHWNQNWTIIAMTETQELEWFVRWLKGCSNPIPNPLCFIQMWVEVLIGCQASMTPPPTTTSVNACWVQCSVLWLPWKEWINPLLLLLENLQTGKQLNSGFKKKLHQCQFTFLLVL